MGRARYGIGGLARRIRPVGRLSVGLVPDGRGHLVASGGHLERQVLHALRFEPDFTAAVPRPVAIWYASWPDDASTAVHILDGQQAPPPPGAVRAPAPHIPAYLIGYQDGRRELLDIFAEHRPRADELAAVSATFARSGAALKASPHTTRWRQPTSCANAALTAANSSARALCSAKMSRSSR